MTEENKSVTPEQSVPAQTTPPADQGEKTTPPSDDKGEDTLLGGEPKKKKEGTTDEPGKTEETKPQAPEKYDFKLPENVTLDKDLVDKITPVFKELGISQEGAQKLVDIYAPYIAQVAERDKVAAVEHFNSEVKAWGEETKKLLGPEPQKELAAAAKVIDTFCDKPKELRQLFNDLGIGNHPLLVSMLIKAGKSISADAFAEGKSSAVEETEEGRASRMFPSMKK